MQHAKITILPLLTLVLGCLVLTSCGGTSNHTPNEDYADLQPFRPNSTFANELKPCVEDSSNRSCSLSTLPLLGMLTANPSREEILDRVVVSHRWMGERFEEILASLPDDFLPIFRSITAIVIDDDIRPAHYTRATGAIYLDPAYLWLTVEEAQSINPKEDYRSDYADPLSFRSVYRYVVGFERAYQHRDFRNPEPRELDDIRLLFANLLLHELAHANDVFPPHSLQTLSANKSVIEAANDNYPDWISTQLSSNSPLESQVMYVVAGIFYRGVNASATEKAISLDYVAIEFALDSAADDYAYTSQFEDVAMLFEEIMMLYFFNADRQIAFTSTPDEDGSCNSYVIGWGQQNRISNPHVLARARFVVEQIFPNLIPASFYENVAATTQLPEDIGWCDLLVAEPFGSNEKVKNPNTEKEAPVLSRPWL